MYTHRGAPGDVITIGGQDIEELNSSFFKLSSGAYIPYHRLVRIIAEKSIIWEKDSKK